MSTKPHQNEAGENQEREVIDVIEVPPVKSQSGGAEIDESDVTNDVEATVPDVESTADVETDIDVDPEGSSDLETTKGAHVIDGEDEDDIESETGGQTEQVEEDDAETSTKTETPAHFQWAVTGGTLKSVLSTIGAIVEETRIHIDNDGLRMRAVDPANVAMDDLEISAAAFEAFDATPGVIAVDLERFADIIKLAGKDDLVQVKLDEETRKLLIQIDGLEFNMACLAPESLRAEPDTPDLDLPAEATVARNALDRGIKAADMVSDHVSVRIDGQGERFLIEAESDTDEVSFEIADDDIEFEAIDDANSWFSLDYMKKLVKSMPASADVTVSLGTDFPLIMRYDIADGNCHVTRMLAPRIVAN